MYRSASVLRGPNPAVPAERLTATGVLDVPKDRVSGWLRTGDPGAIASATRDHAACTERHSVMSTIEFSVLPADEPDDDRPSDFESCDYIHVVPLEPDGDWVLQVPPPSAAKSAERRFERRERPEVSLSPRSRECLFLAAVDPMAVADERVKRQRVSTGWVYRIEDVRVFTPMVNVSPANDRLLAEATYAADPTFSTPSLVRLPAAPLPTSHPLHAALVYVGDRGPLRTASDANAQSVRKDNPIDVGARIVEQTITLSAAVYAERLDSAGVPIEAPDVAAPEEFVAIDGNSRTAAAFKNLRFPGRYLPLRLQSAYGSGDAEVQMQPSLLSQMTNDERRDLTRKMLKAYSDVYEAGVERIARGEILSARERTGLDVAASAINSMTLPVTVIVGYVDDDQSTGTQRFAAATREVLQGMNVAPKSFAPEARNGVSAEQAVAALHERRLLGPEQASSAGQDATYDLLIGRTSAAAAMATLRLGPLADLRGAVVLREFTRSRREHSKALQGPLNTQRVSLSKRAHAASELIVRGYSASRDEADIDRMRRLLGSGSGCAWKALTEVPWEVRNIDTDDEVDQLVDLALADLSDHTSATAAAACLLGAIGMVALVQGQYLQPAGGSAENTAAELEDQAGRVLVQRGGVGLVVESLLERRWGVILLGDAIKRSRAGLSRRVIDPTSEQFREVKDGSPVYVNAYIRRQLFKAGEPVVEPKTVQQKQQDTVKEFDRAVRGLREPLQQVIDAYAETASQVPHEAAADALRFLEAFRQRLLRIVEVPVDDLD